MFFLTMGLWDFFSFSHSLIVFFWTMGLWDSGTLGLWDVAADIKILREAHLTFEAKLRNASTLLRLGIVNTFTLLSP